ncbi:hypothetical protein KQX54_018521 [Cotesia glomerata]|uniref:Uncharacterized protein n=1 Tax=Cotesia glomerata TaxID=32391 RepID=A0AAV7J8M0_COTGL|nr:hypothetical protein KQX54_018521 [Cotesia glomerata]
MCMQHSSRGRVVKASDSKSDSLWERRIEQLYNEALKITTSKKATPNVQSNLRAPQSRNASSSDNIPLETASLGEDDVPTGNQQENYWQPQKKEDQKEKKNIGSWTMI